MRAVLSSDVKVKDAGPLRWFDAVVMLTKSGYKSEPTSRCYQYATRFARTLPVLCLQPGPSSETALEIEKTDCSNVELVHTTTEFGQKQVNALLALLRARGIKHPVLWIYDPLHYQPLIDAMPNAFRVFHATEDYFPPADGLLNLESIINLNQIDLLIGESKFTLHTYQQHGYRRATVLAEPTYESVANILDTAAPEFADAVGMSAATRSDAIRKERSRQAAEEYCFDHGFATACQSIMREWERMRSRAQKLNIAILYDEGSKHIECFCEHLNAFRTYLPHQVYFIHATTYGADVTEHVDYYGGADLSLFDVVIVHYSVRLSHPPNGNFSPAQIHENVAEDVARFDGLKILFIQDEYETTENARRWMDKLQFDIVYTTVPHESVELVYPRQRFPTTEFLPTLTGYVPEDPFLDNYACPLEQRDIVIGYRGRTLPYYYGLLAREKYDIGVQVKRLAEERGIPVDIDVDNEKRIYGIDWYRFLGSVRATLGTESGSNVFDFDGKLKAGVAAVLAEDPDLTFEEIHQELIAGHEGPVSMNQVSPKIFEAIRLRTALVLFEGTYSGVVKPHLHYIPLKKDYSNIDEVFEKLQDRYHLQELTERAYKEIIESGAYSYRRFAEGVAADIAARTWRNPRHERFTPPVALHSIDAIKIEPPAPVLAMTWQEFQPQSEPPLLLQLRVRKRFPRLYRTASFFYKVTRSIYYNALRVAVFTRRVIDCGGDESKRLFQDK